MAAEGVDLPAALAADLDLLVGGQHGDPHRVLGFHDDRIWALRPDAVAVRALVSGGASLHMEQVHPGGVWASPAGDAPSDYRLEAHYPSGSVVVQEDPYRFWPTIGETDLQLLGAGNHRRLWQALGAHVRTHQGVAGTSFAVWAPNARSVRVVGAFNLWDGRLHPMRSMGSSGVWELFLPGVGAGAQYKYEILTAEGHLTLKADPLAFAAERAPGTNSVVAESTHVWADEVWIARRDRTDIGPAPLSIYEVHPGSWRRDPDDADRALSYRELAEQLPDYVAGMGFTHVELMAVAEHPFDGSWGYQVTSYFAPTSRHGSPDDFRALVEAFHQRGLGVLIDWVPAHFPRDDWALARFDGSPLYEHQDPRQGEHPEWGTLVFNFGRNEVRNFLVANANYWLEEFHIDGLRVDGVASMLYLDYSRKEGEWVPNVFGGRENLEAVAFLRDFNEAVHEEHPGAITVAEESTSWGGVSRPTSDGGLGFGFKWNMGWMHDTLEYFSNEPVHRRHHHDDLTFGMLYAFTEDFILPLSHDEVVHGKGSLLDKMPGDRWQKAANLRALLAWMGAHPGKQLLFMGGEIAQSEEWSHQKALDWHLLEYPEHRGVQDLVRTLNEVYRDEPALWQHDFSPDGFRWIDASDVEANVAAFLRFSADGRPLACVANLSPVPRPGYRIGLPTSGTWRKILDTDAVAVAGSGLAEEEPIHAQELPWTGLPCSAELTLPPLGVLWLIPE
ncbi:MAG: 1,4-alpha-glucan branching protein GlgB [Actinomycetota bacterium]|nr:1,4-alpha-glucan branching protein GlgB [Actinomycetota bacterium]